MSGYSDVGKCPRCGGSHFLMEGDTKVYPIFHAICVDCGFAVNTIPRLASLHEINTRRAALDDIEQWPSIGKLKEPVEDWIKYDWESGLKREEYQYRSFLQVFCVATEMDLAIRAENEGEELTEEQIGDKAEMKIRAIFMGLLKKIVSGEEEFTPDFQLGYFPENP